MSPKMSCGGATIGVERAFQCATVWRRWIFFLLPLFSLFSPRNSCQVRQNTELSFYLFFILIMVFILVIGLYLFFITFLIIMFIPVEIFLKPRED